MTECSLGKLNCWLQQTLFCPLARREAAPGAHRRGGAAAALPVFCTPLHRLGRGREAGAHVGGAKTCSRCRTAKKSAGDRPLATFAATVRNSAVPA